MPDLLNSVFQTLSRFMRTLFNTKLAKMNMLIANYQPSACVRTYLILDDILMEGL